MGLRPTKQHGIDRLDNDRHYSCGHCEECLANGWPANCEWKTPKEQQNNRSDNVRLEWQGKTQTAQQWADEFGLPGYLVRGRLRRGWTLEESLTAKSVRGRTKNGHNRNRPSAAIKRAGHVVEMAIARGDLPRVRSLVCIRCGKQAANYHHYKGYAPEHHLDVVPTCARCHCRLEALGRQAVEELLQQQSDGPSHAR